MDKKVKHIETQTSFAANVIETLTHPKALIVAAGASLVMMMASSCSGSRGITTFDAANGKAKCGRHINN